MTNMKKQYCSRSLFRAIFILAVQCFSLIHGVTYCADQSWKCNDEEYCDPGYRYCMPCKLICNGPMHHEGECNEKCPDNAKQMKSSTESKNVSQVKQVEATVAPKSALLQHQEDGGYSHTGVLYTATISLVIICIVSVLGLACYLVRRKKSSRHYVQDTELQDLSQHRFDQAAANYVDQDAIPPDEVALAPDKGHLLVQQGTDLQRNKGVECGDPPGYTAHM